MQRPSNDDHRNQTIPKRLASGYGAPGCLNSLIAECQVDDAALGEAKYAHYENDNAPIKTFDKPFVLPARFAACSTRTRLLFLFADRSSCYPGTGRVPSKFQRKDRVSRAL